MKAHPFSDITDECNNVNTLVNMNSSQPMVTSVNMYKKMSRGYSLTILTVKVAI